MQVGVLAVQGAFAEHEHVLSELGVPCIELRNAGDLNKPYDALILPGGEYIAMGLSNGAILLFLHKLIGIYALAGDRQCAFPSRHTAYG